MSDVSERAGAVGAMEATDAAGPPGARPRVIGPYLIVGPLGEGGMGAVHLGRDARGRAAAVKVLRPGLVGDPEMLRRFRREADTASAVRGPGVAAVLEHRLDGATPWIATEYLAGPTLHAALRVTGPFAEPALRALGAALATGLTTVHAAGLVHRDLKPGNIVLTREGPRIIDFGIARPEYGLTLTAPGSVAATPGYAPPEQVRGRRTGPAGDVFALGAVLAFAATGRPLYGGGHPASVHYRVVYEEPRLEGVPGPLRDLVRACLAHEPAARPRPAALVEAWAEGDGPGFAVPPWHTGALAAEIARQESDAAGRLAAAEPLPPADTGAGTGTGTGADTGTGVGLDGGPRSTRRQVLAVSGAAGAVAALAGAGWGAWRLLGGAGGGGGGQEVSAAGVPVAPPVRRQADGAAPSPLWQTDGLRGDGPGPVVVGRVVAAATRRGLAAWRQHTGERAWLWRWPDGEAPEGPERPDDGDAEAVPPALLGAPPPDGPAGAPLLCATGGGRLTALDARTGARRWSTGAADAREVLAVGTRRAYVLDGERRVRAVRLADGSPRWRAARPVEGEGRVAAALAGGTLLAVGAEGEAVALDTGDGRTRWRRRLWNTAEARRAGLPRAGTLAPAALDGAFCVGGRALAVLDARDGTARWTRPAQDVLWGTPTVAAGRVHVSGGDQLTCWDARSGRQRWTAGLRHNALSQQPAVVLGHALYEALGAVPVAGDDERFSDAGVATVDTRDGSRAWTLSDDRPEPGWHLTGAAGRVFVRRRGVLRAMPVL
ncbi:serine/threonine-protein kinase [Streptomyces albiaxialis]|uniref:serine/threonine-protein kinase n=1 Tax=Streptomyces albiaxialis TaxID=329523 RepID=UPI0031D79647